MVSFTRISLASVWTKEGEQVHPMFLPVKNQSNLEYFTGELKEALEKGEGTQSNTSIQQQLELCTA